MGFKEAVRVCLTEKYVTFSGRASRSEYWWFMLFLFIVPIGFVAIGAATIDYSSATLSTISWIMFVIAGLFYLAMALPALSVLVRRFHDRNLSGWWYLASIVVGIIPYIGILASIAVFVITVLKGTEGDNKFGPDPLNLRSGAEVFA